MRFLFRLKYSILDQRKCFIKVLCATSVTDSNFPDGLKFQILI